MSSIEHQMTEIYCFIDDYLKAHPRRAGWRRSPNRHPAFTDAEVVTIARLQGSFGCATLKKAYLLVRANWSSLPASGLLQTMAGAIARCDRLGRTIDRGGSSRRD